MSEIDVTIEQSLDHEINGEIVREYGTTDYNELENKPSINGVELFGDLTTDDLGIKVNVDIDTSQFATKDEIPTKTSELENDSKFVDETLLGQTGEFLVKEIDYTKGLVNELSEKVDNLPTGGAEYTAGDGITVSENNEIISNTVIRSKGLWNSTTAYKAGEIVTYNLGEANGRCKFMCIADNTGVTPTIFSSNNYWAYIPTQDYLVATSSSDVPICCAKSNGASGSYATAWRINVPKMAIYVSKLPTVNLQTGLMKCPSGIEGYYTKAEVDALLEEIKSMIGG